MSGIDPERSFPQASESDSAYPSEALNGKDAITRAFINAMMSVSNPMFAGDIELPDEVWKNLKEITDQSVGALEPSPWLCLNLETGEMGRAYPFRGEYRIRTATATDTDLAQAQASRNAER